MEDVFHLAVTGDRFHEIFRHINDSLLAGAKGRRYDLKMMNSLWYAKGAEIQADCRRVVKNYYGASALPVNMAPNPEAARRIINSWFEKQSRGKFKDLIAAGMLSPQARLVLANVIYFRGAWASKFDKRDTQEAQFTLLDGKQVVARMMRQTGKFNYAETDKFQALELPYKGSRLSMIILLPKERDGLTNVANSLSKQNIEEWLKGMSKKEIDVNGLPTVGTGGVLEVTLNSAKQVCRVRSVLREVASVTQEKSIFDPYSLEPLAKQRALRDVRQMTGDEDCTVKSVELGYFAADESEIQKVSRPSFQVMVESGRVPYSRLYEQAYDLRDLERERNN